MIEFVQKYIIQGQDVGLLDIKERENYEDKISENST